MPITLNHSNINVQYSSDKSYIIETVKSDLYRRNENVDTVIRNNIQTAPVTPTTYVDSSGNVYAVESYTYSGTADTADYTRVFTKNTTCDILIVGGGGGGGGSIGGGGGGGSVIYSTNITIPTGSYNILIGKGGSGGVNETDGAKGADSTAFGATAFGGGRGGDYNVSNSETSGGSGGGEGGGANNNLAGVGVAGLKGTNTIPNTSLLFTNYQYYVNDGGLAFYQSTATNLNATRGGGGGGAGTAGGAGGGNAIDTTTQGLGGDGIPISISGNVVYYGAGGGGGAHKGSNSQNLGKSGGLGGGGNGGNEFSNGTKTNGTDGTGFGAGGGGGSYSMNGGNGGYGIVIIKYLLGTIPTTNFLTNEPVVTAPIFTETIRTFVHSGGTEAQTTYNITVPQNTICDILIVGGGGGGDREIGGGGGGGAVLYATNITISAGSYQIKVGKGGAQNENGSSSEAFGAICLGGGSTSFGGWAVGNNGNTGGSGSGASAGSTASQPIFTGGDVGISTKGTLLSSGTLYNGNIGGSSRTKDIYHAGGGGGGAGTPGNNSIANGVTKNTTRQGWIDAGYPQKGGDGVPINITGTTYYWGAGGGGGSYDTHGGDGGLGGGGGGGSSIQLAGLAGTGGINNGGNGVGQRTGAAPYEVGGFGAPNTGSGGGGGGYFGVASGGAGGSGIVIIKFKSNTNAAVSEGTPATTHKRLNFTYVPPNYPIIQADTTNLKAWYKFDGNYNDSSSSGFNLTNSGAEIVDGLIEESLSTNGSDFLETSGINLNGKTYSISFWLKFNSSPSGDIFIFSQSSSYSPGLTVVFQYVGSPNVLRFSHYGSGNDMDTTGYNISNMIGTSWHHYVITYNNTNRGAEIWVDGAKLSTNISTLTNAFTGGGNFMIAKLQSYPVNSVNGLFEDFRYYDKILTSTEIYQLYNIPSTNQYTLNFPVPTLTDINNNSNIILRGAYDIYLSTINSLIIPKEGQYIPKLTTFASDLLSIRYNILNPTNDPIGAQWVYNTSNINVYTLGNVGIGTTNPQYTLDVSGSVNAKSYYLNGRQINEPLSELGLSEGMIAQVRHLTYTQMDVKNNTGWDAINDNLTTGFVIAITPKSNLSKILVNIIVHIGLAASNYSVWWGIKLYRKIGTGNWTEVTGPNGTETGSAAELAGTPVWISYTMYGGDLDYQYKVANVTGTYLDSPNTTSTVYYTAYWNNKLIDNPSAINTIYLNRAENHGDAYRPAPSSSWTASEIWYG